MASKARVLDDRKESEINTQLKGDLYRRWAGNGDRRGEQTGAPEDARVAARRAGSRPVTSPRDLVLETSASPFEPFANVQ